MICQLGKEDNWTDLETKHNSELKSVDLVKKTLVFSVVENGKYASTALMTHLLHVSVPARVTCRLNA